MSLGLAFYILMTFWLVFGIVWPRWPAPGQRAPWWPLGGDLLLFLLILLLGWKVFGPPLHG